VLTGLRTRAVWVPSAIRHGRATAPGSRKVFGFWEKSHVGGFESLTPAQRRSGMVGWSRWSEQRAPDVPWADISKETFDVRRPIFPVPISGAHGRIETTAVILVALVIGVEASIDGAV
jgi:hypothetical protein